MDMFYYTISQAAKATGTSRRTLLYYDKIGLIEPSFTDGNNGYRYYSDRQLFRIRLVLMLRELDVPIEEIKMYFENNKHEFNKKFIKDQLKRVESKIEELSRIREQLINIDILNERYEKITPFVPKIITGQPFYAEFEAVKDRNNILEINCLVSKLQEKLKKSSNSQYKDIVLIKNKTDILEGNYHAFYKAGLISEYAIDNKHGQLIDFPNYACIYHKGEYPSIHTSYSILSKYLRKNSYEIAGHSFEFYLLNSNTLAIDDKGLIKILVPIRV